MKNNKWLIFKNPILSNKAILILYLLICSQIQKFRILSQFFEQPYGLGIIEAVRDPLVDGETYVVHQLHCYIPLLIIERLHLPLAYYHEQ